MVLPFPLLHFALLSNLHFPSKVVKFRVTITLVIYYILGQKLFILRYYYYILRRNRYDGVNYLQNALIGDFMLATMYVLVYKIVLN